MKIHDMLAERMRLEWDSHNVFVFLQGDKLPVKGMDTLIGPQAFASELNALVQKHFPGTRTRLTTLNAGGGLAGQSIEPWDYGQGTQPDLIDIEDPENGD